MKAFCCTESSAKPLLVDRSSYSVSEKVPFRIHLKLLVLLLPEVSGHQM
jgi:hypothetical protein